MNCDSQSLLNFSRECVDTTPFYILVMANLAALVQESSNLQLQPHTYNLLGCVAPYSSHCLFPRSTFLAQSIQQDLQHAAMMP